MSCDLRPIDLGQNKRRLFYEPDGAQFLKEYEAGLAIFQEGVWSLSIRYSDKAIQSSGDNNYPANDGSPTNEFVESAPFERLFAAIRDCKKSSWLRSSVRRTDPGSARASPYHAREGFLVLAAPALF